MSKTNQTTRRRSPVALPIPSDAKPVSETVRNVYALVSSGNLPPADTVTKDGQPAWKFESLAAILGCSENELLRVLSANGAPFNVEPGARH
jgi:hypothetical protein